MSAGTASRAEAAQCIAAIAAIAIAIDVLSGVTWGRVRSWWRWRTIHRTIDRWRDDQTARARALHPGGGR